MKKFFSFACALFACVAAFATVEVPTNRPDDATLNAYKNEGDNVVVAFYTTAPICNDIVFTGSYCGWSTDPAALVKFDSIENFPGWYVTSFNDTTASIAGKPVQLKSDGTFAWDYQIGDDAVFVSGTVTIAPSGQGISGEVDLTGFGTDAPVVFAFGKWKNDNNPCVVAERHHYTVILDAPSCAGEDGKYFDPAIIGTFNTWSEGVPMELITEGEHALKYKYEFEDEVGHEFKFRAANITDWSNQIQLRDSAGNWYDNPNITLGADTVIILDYSEGKYTLCVEEQTAVENVEAKNVRKVIENGRLVIYVGEERYNVLGIKE